MNILIVGAGASGVTAAINLKRKNPNDEILIIEQLDKPLKKILATGNGKCNLGNANLDFALFNNSTFVKEVLKEYDYKSFFDSISIKTKLIGDLAYPISESAVSVREALLNQLRKLRIKLNVNEKLVDYTIKDQIEVTTNVRKYIVDKLVLAGGLKSSSKLGSDGSVVNILTSHGYKITQLKPGLSPIFTKEKTREIDGVRVKANVKLLCENKILKEEKGEVLFKDHGLSGIVVFNMMSVISRQINTDLKLSLDLLPDYSNIELNDYLKNHDFEELLLAFINPKIIGYLKNRFSSNEQILNSLKDLTFTFDRSYGFDFSQVTVGGVKLDEIDRNFMSKREKNVYIIGELLDVDGPCGGYNLTWAFGSALKL